MGTQVISNLATYSQKATDRASKVTILVALLFLSPLLAGIPGPPEEDVSMMTSGRQSGGPDVAVTDLHVTTPSVLVSGVPTLAPQNHIIRVGRDTEQSDDHANRFGFQKANVQRER